MEPRQQYESANQVADRQPTAEFVAVVLGKVEFHLRAGHFAIAARVIEAAAVEWQEEERDQQRELELSPDDWLDRSIFELDLLLRNVNALEGAGCHTIRQAIALLNKGGRAASFGQAAEDEFWAAVRAKKITIPRKYAQGNKIERTPEEQARIDQAKYEKFNPRFPVGGPRKNRADS